MKRTLVLACAAVFLLGASLAAGRVRDSTFGGSERAAGAAQSARDEPGGTGWPANAAGLRGRNGARFVFLCPLYGVARAVYGTDVYTDDSSVCTAAVHAGLITLAGGGSVTIEIRPGQGSYAGSTRHGITSNSYGVWSGSFAVVAASAANPGVGPGGTGWSLGPGFYRSYVGVRFAYSCPAKGTPGTVWGTDVYTDDSSVCTAAVHAGLITAAGGGSVTIEIRPGQSSYAGSTRNGITSNSYGVWSGSFAVVAGSPSPGVSPGGTGWAAASAAGLRGGNGARFVFLCPLYGVAGAVYGTDVYTDDSSVCTAAVHAGLITLAGGGSVTIEIRPGQGSYAGSTRHGITSNSYPAFGGSYAVVAASAANPGVGPGGTGWSLGPGFYRSYLGARFAYSCPAKGTPGTVWGTDVYTDDSSVCTAAVHAGLITAAGGGSVTIEIRPGQSSYAGSTRHGIKSGSYPAFGGSFVFTGSAGGGGGGQPPPPAGTPTGTVFVNGRPFTGGAIPYRSKVDVTNGTLLLKTDLGSVLVYGGGVSANFVLLRAMADHKPIVEFLLAGGNFGACKRLTAAVSKAPPKPVRQLWGNGKGRFETAGHYAAASVRGTLWLVVDRCDGTLTQVKRGIVQVFDLVRKKKILLRAGQSYLAKKP